MTLESRLPCPSTANCRAAGTAWTHEPTQTRDVLSWQESKRNPKATKGHREQSPPHQTQICHPQPVSENHCEILVMGWANMPTQHETPFQRSSLTSCQKAGQALLHTKLNEISFLVLLSFFRWSMLNYLRPYFINLPQLFPLNL